MPRVCPSPGSLATACVALTERKPSRWAERHRRGYVLTVTSAQRVGLRAVSERIEDLPPEAWQRLSAGEGAKGPRLYDWARLDHAGGAAGFRCALLVRRSIAKPAEVTFYLTHAPEATTLDGWCGWPARAGASRACLNRPRVRSGLTSMRSDPGSAGTATSPWRCSPWLISAPSARALSGGQDPADLAAELLPITVPEVRRLLWLRFGQSAPEPAAALRWSTWRRRHQQRARRVHWYQRTQGSRRKTRL